MKNIILYIIGILSVLMVSCIDDNSSLGDNPLSLIRITTENDTLTHELGYEMVYEPKEITQDMEDMELSYEWACHGYSKNKNGQLVADPLEVISTERVLRYSFPKLGEYGLRLKVTNAHGSSFAYLTVFVRAAFEEGLFILSEDEAKKGRISFMRKLSREDIEAGKEEVFDVDIWERMHPSRSLTHPVGVCISGYNLFLLAQEEAVLYGLDAQTFEMMTVTDMTDGYPWMKPSALMNKPNTNSSMLALSETGGAVEIDYYSNIPFNGDKLFPDRIPFDKWCDKTIRGLRGYDHCGFFANSSEHLLVFAKNYTNPVSYNFPNENLLGMTVNSSQEFWMISQKVDNSSMIKISRFGCYYDGNIWRYPELTYEYENSNPTLEKNSKILCNDRYRNIFYSTRNKIYRWQVNTQQPQLPENPIITLPETCEITCMSFSSDFMQLYVGVYDSSLPTLKGSLYIFDSEKLDETTGNLQLLKCYEGVADRPIEVFYKPVVR